MEKNVQIHAPAESRPGEASSVNIGQKVKREPESVWKMWRREESVTLSRIEYRLQHRTTRSLITILTELNRLSTFFQESEINVQIITWYIHQSKLMTETLQVAGFLSAFVKFRKATSSFIMPVRLSAWNIQDPTELVFMKSDVSVSFENLSRKFTFH